MPALSLFTDFFTQTTGPAYLSGPDDVINDAQLRNFEAQATFFKSRKEVQGGASIKDMILLDDPLTAGTYQPGDAATVTNVQGGTTISLNWRFCRVPIVWTEAEVLLNEGGGASNATTQFHQFKKLRNFKYQQGFTSLVNKMERLLVAAASNADMETAAGTEPYSIFASITNDGLAPSGFTTVQGVNPSTSPNWRNQNTTYTHATPYDTDVGIIAGMDAITQLVHFKRPPNYQQYFQDDSLSRHVIFTDRTGRQDYMKAIRANNDITRAGPQDPSYGSPVFNNIPVSAVEGFDDRNAFTASQPAFIFINMNHMKLIFHREKFMQKSEVMGFADKPDTKVMWVDTYINLFDCSRARHGWLDPT